jgi:plasmid stabilization system protein ParE
MRLRVAPEADEELAEAAEWYEARRTGLGVEFVAVIDRALEDILSAPLTYQCWRPDRAYRRKVLQRFPFVIFFLVEMDEITIVAVAHSRRRPGYWVARGPGSPGG